MGVFSRLADIISANINALLERAEDPEKMIGLIIQEMEDTLVEVRASTVKVIAEKKEMLRRMENARRDAEAWGSKAELALSRDREDLAREALRARAKADAAAEAVGRDLKPLDEALAKADDDISRLKEKLEEARQRQKSLAARRTAAVIRVKARAKLHDDRIANAFARFEQVERGLDEMEGRAESYDLGQGGPSAGRARGPSLAEQINNLETEDRVERELATLKARRSAGGAAPPPVPPTRCLVD